MQVAAESKINLARSISLGESRLFDELGDLLEKHAKKCFCETFAKAFSIQWAFKYTLNYLSTLDSKFKALLLD